MGKLESKIVGTVCSRVAGGGGRTLAVFAGRCRFRNRWVVQGIRKGREGALSNLLLHTSCLARAAVPVPERRPLLPSFSDRGTKGDYMYQCRSQSITSQPNKQISSRWTGFEMNNRICMHEYEPESRCKRAHRARWSRAPGISARNEHHCSMRIMLP